MCEKEKPACAQWLETSRNQIAPVPNCIESFGFDFIIRVNADLAVLRACNVLGNRVLP
jgi:hypothetical protein